MEQKKSIAVIGGGFLGLTIAYELAKRKQNVTLYERTSNLGGLASGFTINDFPIERYYHHWFKGDTDIRELMAELGIEEAVHFHESSAGVWFDGKLYDFSTSLDILRFPPLNIFQRIRLGLVSMLLQKTKNYHRFENISAIDWCYKYFGKRVTEVVWLPLLKGKFGDKYKTVAMSWLWARIWDRSSSRPNPLSKEFLGYPRGGFQMVVDKLVEACVKQGVKFETGVNITAHEYKNQKHLLKFTTARGINEQAEHERIVATVPGPVFTQIFKVPADVKKKIEKTEYLGAIATVLVLRKQFSPYYWMNINDASYPFMAVVEHTNFLPKEHYGGDHIMYVAKYLDTEAEQFAKSEAELLELNIEYLQKIRPDFDKSWIKESFVFKAKYAQHIVPVGYEIPPFETGVPGLYLANFAQIYPHDRGTSYAVKQGREVAQRILEEFSENSKF